MHDRPQMDSTLESVQRFRDYESAFPQRCYTSTRSARLVNRVDSYIKACDTFFDYGCARGFLVAELLITGASVTAAEHSPESVARVAALGAALMRKKGSFAPVCQLVEA